MWYWTALSDEVWRLQQCFPMTIHPSAAFAKRCLRLAFISKCKECCRKRWLPITGQTLQIENSKIGNIMMYALINAWKASFHTTHSLCSILHSVYWVQADKLTMAHKLDGFCKIALLPTTYCYGTTCFCEKGNPLQLYYIGYDATLYLWLQICCR